MELPDSIPDNSEESQVNQEMHHFQLVNENGEIPLSISILIRTPRSSTRFIPTTPISYQDVVALHDALEHFDGDFITAFKQLHS